MDADAGLLDRVRAGLDRLVGEDGRGPPIIVVSGLPRSGTSMMMQALDEGGLDVVTDGRRQADEDNPEGYYEHERVKALPEGDTGWLAEARGRPIKVISALLPHLPPEHRYEIVFMRRDLDEVLASQRRMLERQGPDDDRVDDEALRQEFRDHLHEVQRWTREQASARLQEVRYDRVLAEPRPAFAEVEAFLSAELDVDAMASVVDPDLYRQRA